MRPSKSPSKMQTEKVCYISGRTDNLVIHHCLNGTHQRKKCDEDGLTVWLNARIHDYIHHTIEGREYLYALKKDAQRVYERDHTRDEFIKRYGKSYL